MRKALLGAVLTALLVSGLTPAARAADHPRPVLLTNFADPAVERFGSGYVGFATGERAPRAWTRARNGTWKRQGPALKRLPSWSRPGDVWAADVKKLRGWWVLYYSAPVRGLGEHGRCIGVARSRHPLRDFAPVGKGPLVCPAYVRQVPAAGDPLLPRDHTLPRAGVIDPSLFVAEDGPVLLYKTDRIPSSIRVVPLNQQGTKVRRGAVSTEVLRSNGVVENPLLVQRPEGWVMLLSEGDYTRCTYRTIWLRSASSTDWTGAETGVLLDRTNSGLCGPGGADVAGKRLFLHGWVCHGKPKPCAKGFDWSKRKRQRAQRAMYAARLRWVDGLPVVTGWLER